MEKRETNAEMVARVENDPQRLAKVAVREAELGLVRERLRKELLPVIGDLQSLGLRVTNLIGMRERPSGLKGAYPVLLQHLKMPYSNAALKTIVYLFVTREARPFLDAIVALYETTVDDPELPPGVSWRDRLAYAIGEMATKSDFPILERLIRDKKLGTGRIMLVPAVIKLGRDAGWEVLRSLAADPALSKEIAFRISEKERRERAKQKRALEGHISQLRR
jgi:hypothetical protein